MIRGAAKSKVSAHGLHAFWKVNEIKTLGSKTIRSKSMM